MSSASAKHRYVFSQACAWGLTGSCAVLGLAGVLGMFTPDGAKLFGLDRTGWCVLALASVMAFAILQVNNMAEAAMHAIDRPGGWKSWHWPTLAPALFCGVGFAIAANVGVHLGYGILRASAAHPEALPEGQVVDQIFLFLSCAKPLSMLAIAGRKAMDRAKLEAANAAEEARTAHADDANRAHRHEENLARIRAEAEARAAREAAPNSTQNILGEPVKENGPPPKGHKLKVLKGGAKGAAVAAAALELLAGGGQAQALPISAQTEPVAHSQTLAQTVKPWAERTPAEKEAAKLDAIEKLAAGHKPGPVSRATGAPLSSCKRWALEVAEAA